MVIGRRGKGKPRLHSGAKPGECTARCQVDNAIGPQRIVEELPGVILGANVNPNDLLGTAGLL